MPDPDWAWTEGRRLTDAAAEAGLPPGELLLDLLVATRLDASAVIDAPPTTTDDGLRTLLRHPAHVGGSDGIFIGGHPHPRGWGAFARYLGRARPVAAGLDLAGGGGPPVAPGRRRFGLTDRGVLRPGAAADLVVLDPATVADRATYERPARARRRRSTMCWWAGCRYCGAAR